MQPDPELEQWRRDWQAQDVIAQNVRRRVDRESRQIRREVAMEVAVTVVMGGGSLAWAVITRRTDAVVLAAAIWGFIAIGWTASVLLRRGTWKPAATTTAAFLELSALRCRRKLRAGVVAAMLYVVILAFDLVWIYYYQAQTRPLDPWAFLTSLRFLWVWAGTLVLGGIAVWHRRRLHRELRNLAELQRQVADENLPLRGIM